MRTFKLIEEYYDSPKKGTIIREDNLGQLVSEQLEIFKIDEILKYPKHWQEFVEVDYTGVKFKCKDSNIIYGIIEKTVDAYILAWSLGLGQTKCKISNANDEFRDGQWVKLDEQPRYVIGFDTASEGSDSDFVNFRLQFGKVEQIWSNKKPEFEVLSYVVEKPKPNKPITGKFEEIKIYSIKRLSDSQIFTIGDSVKLWLYSFEFKITEFSLKDDKSMLVNLDHGAYSSNANLSEITKN